MKHRFINTPIKTAIATLFSVFGYMSWEGGKLASIEIARESSYNLMIFGIVTGIMGTLALFIFTDVITHLLKYRRGKVK